jgi:hypothetical protein
MLRTIWTSLLSPADVLKDVEHQFDFLFSLSQEQEYTQLLQQAGEVPVRST